MAIIGLTDSIIPRFQRIGKLRKGGEKSGTGYGPDLDHFRFTSDHADAKAIVDAFHDIYTATPRLLRVFIPYQRLDDAFGTCCELWSKSGLQHRCDGKTMSVWRDGSGYQRGAKPCPGGHEKNDFRNDSVGRLEVILPELVQAGFVGYVTLETHSLHDILHISQVLAAVYESRGDLRGVEFTLRRMQETISTPGWGERSNDRSKVKKWLVKIVPSPQWVQVQLETSRVEALGIEAPATVIDGDTGEIIERPSLPAPSTPTAAPQPAAEITDDERKYFGTPPEEQAATGASTTSTTTTSQPPAAEKQAGTNGKASTVTEAAPTTRTWHPNGLHVAAEPWNGTSWKDFLFIKKLEETNVKKALGTHLVSEWLKKDPEHRTPDQARYLVLATTKTRDEWLTVWSSVYNDAKGENLELPVINGKATSAQIVEHIDMVRAMLLDARAKQSQKEPAHV